MMLDKLSVSGRPTKLDKSRARAYCACSRCGWWLFGHFFPFICHFSLPSPSLWETNRYRRKYCLKGPLCCIDDVLLFYVHGQHLKSCLDGQLT